MFFAYSRDNAMPHFNLLEMFTLENIYKFKAALFTLKITNNATSVPTIFSGTLTIASGDYSYNTRFVSNLNFHRPRITLIMVVPRLLLRVLSKTLCIFNFPFSVIRYLNQVYAS